MRSEPIYTFRKGEGWVLQTAPTAEFEKGYFRCAIEQREPGPHECFIISRDYTDLDDFTDWMKRNWNWLYHRTNPDLEHFITKTADKLAHTLAGLSDRENWEVFTVNITRIHNVR